MGVSNMIYRTQKEKLWEKIKKGVILYFLQIRKVNDAVLTLGEAIPEVKFDFAVTQE